MKHRFKCALVLIVLSYKKPVYSCGTDSKSESDSNTEAEMASYSHEDAAKLGYEQSEETYRVWDKYWKAVTLNKTENILTVTQ
ncbi:jg7871, partial [Pararge aegeria aegeria]